MNLLTCSHQALKVCPCPLLMTIPLAVLNAMALDWGDTISLAENAGEMDL